jgi:5-formyltetrahydrofolate cyclo-ligase
LTKTALRETLKARLAAVPPHQFTAAGQEAARHLSVNIPQWGAFLSVLAFASLKDEIDTLPVIEAVLNKRMRVFLPKVAGDMLTFYRIDRHISAREAGNAELPEGLVPGAFGILEPAADPILALAPEDFPVLVVTPGRAFDRLGRRLGRGKGYYDRFFAALDEGRLNGPPAGAPLPYTAIGFCLDCQLVDEVPAESYDKTMNAVLTERGLCLKTAIPGGF